VGPCAAVQAGEFRQICRDLQGLAAVGTVADDLLFHHNSLLVRIDLYPIYTTKKEEKQGWLLVYIILIF
jgi:hypothetical protein